MISLTLEYVQNGHGVFLVAKNKDIQQLFYNLLCQNISNKYIYTL